MRPTSPRRPASLLALAALLALASAAASAGGSAPQSKDQQKCITSFGNAAAQVAKARAAENERCLKAFGKGKLAPFGTDSLRSCLSRDAKGKVAKQVAKLEKVADKSCSAPGDVPDFGIAAGGTREAAHQAREQATAPLLDVLSENLFGTALACDDDPDGCKCQQAVADGVASLQTAIFAEFARCAKGALRDGAASAGALGACFSDPALPGSVANDGKRRIENRVNRLTKLSATRCAGVAAPEPFPGQCLGLVGDELAACVAQRAECRACLALNAIHGLDEPCDLADDGVDDGSCPGGAVAQQTLAIPSEAEPAETPGTDGVVVTNEKLLAQFGGGDFDLNRATYTRYHFRNPPSAQPDAILILVPGFEGGAGGFKILAENLIPRAFAEAGKVFEVWGFDRRSHQLEDLAGLELAEANADPQLALNWLFGGELGLDLGPLPRRAEFYDAAGDVPFLASWTYLTHSRDIDAVVEAARLAARDANVFLGGHSAGTGFAARYAATDFDLAGAGPAEPGYAKLRGLVLLEGGGGSSAGGPPSEETLDLIEARFDGGLFGAVRDQAPRCLDGATPCTVATEAADCGALPIARCVEPTTAYAELGGLLSPQLLASAESIALQSTFDPDQGQAILQVEQNGVADNTAVAQVPELAALGAVLPPGTAQGVIGRFVDDDGLIASLAFFIAMSVGAEGPVVDGLATWLDTDEADAFPPCPGVDCVTPDNGPLPTASDAGVWGVEREPIRLDRLTLTLYAGETNFTDWYYPSSGLSVTQGLPSLDSAALSLDAPAGRGRRDIDNVTQASAIDVPVIAFGGSNGLAPIGADFLPFASSIGPCAAPSCDGTPRIVDEAVPSAAFPTFGAAAGGFEVHVTEGYSHVDPLAAEDGPENQVIAPLAQFLSRNAP